MTTGAPPGDHGIVTDSSSSTLFKFRVCGLDSIEVMMSLIHTDAGLFAGN